MHIAILNSGLIIYIYSGLLNIKYAHMTKLIQINNWRQRNCQLVSGMCDDYNGYLYFRNL